MLTVSTDAELLVKAAQIWIERYEAVIEHVVEQSFLNDELSNCVYLVFKTDDGTLLRVWFVRVGRDIGLFSWRGIWQAGNPYWPELPDNLEFHGSHDSEWRSVWHRFLWERRGIIAAGANLRPFCVCRLSSVEHKRVRGIIREKQS